MKTPVPVPSHRYNFGWIPDLPDQRDHLYAAPLKTLQALPPAVDLRPQCPPVLDQGKLGSCTANAIASVFEFALGKQGAANLFTPSRLFIYYNERVLIQQEAVDFGAYLRDGFRTIAADGVCPESDWPYDIARFAVRPAEPLYQKALDHQAIRYSRVDQNLSQLRGCLAEGFPFVFGFTVYTSFLSEETRQTGEAPLPRPEDSVEGGHAVAAVGYDDATQRFLVRNSWGVDWGRKGHFTLPYAYVTNPNLTADLWTLRLVEDAP